MRTRRHAQAQPQIGIGNQALQRACQSVRIIRLDQQARSERTLLVETGGAFVLLAVAAGVTRVSVVGADLADVEAIVERISAAAGELVVEPEGSLRMGFWSYGDGSGQMSTRRVSAPTWADARGNYVRDLKKDDFQIFEDGKPQPVTNFALIDIPIERASALKLGTAVEIIDAGGAVLAPSHVTFISPRADPNTQMVLIKAEIDNQSGHLRATQFTRVRVIWSRREGPAVPVLASAT